MFSSKRNIFSQYSWAALPHYGHKITKYGFLNADATKELTLGKYTATSFPERYQSFRNLEVAI